MNSDKKINSDKETSNRTTKYPLFAEIDVFGPRFLSELFALIRIDVSFDPIDLFVDPHFGWSQKNDLCFDISVWSDRICN